MSPASARSGGLSPQARAVWRAHHPDRGGDPRELQRQLALLDTPHDVVFVTRPKGLRAVAAWVRHRRSGRAPRRVH